MPQSRGLHHLDLVVSDLERSSKSYSALLRPLGWGPVLDLSVSAARRSGTCRHETPGSGCGRSSPMLIRLPTIDMRSESTTSPSRR